MKISPRMPFSEFTLRGGALCAEWPVLGWFSASIVGLFLVLPFAMMLFVLMPVWYVCLKIKEWQDEKKSPTYYRDTYGR